MGYYDESGHYRSFISVPCDNIRMGDILMLEGRPCQVIRISTSAATGRHRYLGVDLFSKQLHEEFSFLSNSVSGVAVQTMYGPSIEKYRMLDVVDSTPVTITAMTESGDIKTSLSIVDQTGFASRLSSAFGKGDSIHVLVLGGFGTDLVFDFKAFPITQDELQTALHTAARAGHLSSVELALRRGAQVDQLDSEGRTALFKAVQGRHKSVVEFLIRSNIDINWLDQRGETALDVAVADTEHPLMALLLLQHGASPMISVQEVVGELLWAAAIGEAEHIAFLLDSGVEVNSQDRLGYTALHEAARLGSAGIVSQLISYGADVNAKATLGGDTVLHTAVERCGKPRQSPVDRRTNRGLKYGHIEVVEILLEKGAVAGHRRADGLTVQALVSKELGSVDLNETERNVLEQISNALKNPPVVERNFRMDPGIGLHRLDDEKMKVCDKFTLRIQYHIPHCYFRREAPVGDFIYCRAETCGQKEAVELEQWVNKMMPKDGSLAEVNSYWRWVHLPANHKTWVKDTISALHNNPQIKFDGGGFNEFIDSSYHEIRGSVSRVRLRRPFLWQFSRPKPAAFSIVIPYFDMETLEEFSNYRDKRNHHPSKKQELERVYLRCDDRPEDLHFPCTLDQSYYLSLDNSTERDETQVVVKYANWLREEMKGSKSALSHESRAPSFQDSRHDEAIPTKPKAIRKLLMVNQMWLWQVDSSTIITAFPDRCHQGQESDLLNHISQEMNRDLPSSMNSTIIKILHEAIGFVDLPHNAGLDENLFEIFKQMIAHWEKAETECFRDFHRAQEDVNKRRQDASKYKIRDMGQFERPLISDEYEEYMCDITKEVEYLSEVKDIRDELKMIEQVLRDQAVVVGQYRAISSELLLPGEMDILNTLEQRLGSRIYVAQRLAKDALSVEDSFNHLLDLKQKQANLMASRDTRSLAKAADNRAKASETQNQLLFVFTVITVVYTPLSFASSLLAVPSRDFPQNGTGGNVGWRWWQVFAAALATEVITLLCIGSFWIRAWRRENQWQTQGGPVQRLMARTNRIPVARFRANTAADLEGQEAIVE